MSSGGAKKVKCFLKKTKNLIRKAGENKTPPPQQLLQKQCFVGHQGLEPWTNRLRVYCSTN